MGALMQYLDLGFTVAAVGGITYYVYKNFFSSGNENLENEWDQFLSEERKERDARENEQDNGVDSNLFTFKACFGTQSGTAEGFATDLSQEAHSYGFHMEIIDLEEWSVGELEEEEFVLFLMATYGEGDPTDNAKEFHSELMKEDLGLANLKYCVYALGNRQYQYFNKTGVDVHKRLKDLGAKPLLDVALGDDDRDIDEHFLNWKEEFWSTISLKLLGKKLKQKQQKGYEPGLTAVARDVEFIRKFQKERLKQKLQCGHPKEKVELATITDKWEVRPSIEDGSTLHLELNIENVDITYGTADNVGILCRNNYEDAEALCTRLGVKPNEVYEITTRRVGVKLPCPYKYITPMSAFLWFFDINLAPKAKVLRIFAQYATEESEKMSLIKLAETSIKDSRDFYTLLRVLEMHPSVNIPFEAIIEILPKLQFRLFTIASSANAQPNSISVCAKLEFHNRKCDDSEFRGIASNYIADMQIGEEVQILVKRSTFKLPRKLESPIIMIGPGTGIAPFRAFVQERKHFQQKNKYGHWRLYFGCRKSDVDYLYREELEAAEKDGILDQLHCAFSRETSEKVYVQHLLLKHGEEIAQLLKQRCYVYVCGASGMGKSVREAFIEILMTQGRKKRRKEAQEHLDLMIQTNRYVQELWG